MDNIDRFQIIEPKVFPSFILEKTLASSNTYKECFPYIKWVGQVFSCIETTDGVDHKVECIYCVVPAEKFDLYINSPVSFDDDYIISPIYGNKSPQIQNYSGLLLFDIPEEPFGGVYYFCLVKKISIDPSITMPEYTAGDKPKILTASGVEYSTKYEWTSPDEPPPTAINIENCIEGMTITEDRVLNFSAVLEDSHYNDFQFKGYNNFFINSMTYWNHFGDISFSNFLSEPVFAPYGLDMQKAVIASLINNQSFFDDSHLGYMVYNITYTFFSSVLNQSHTLKLSREFYVEGHIGAMQIYIDVDPTNISFDNIRIVPNMSSPPSSFGEVHCILDRSQSRLSCNIFLTSQSDPVSNIFSFNAGDNWVISSISAIRTCLDDTSFLPLFADSLPNFEHVTAQNVEQFKAAYGYLMSGFKLEQD